LTGTFILVAAFLTCLLYLILRTDNSSAGREKYMQTKEESKQHLLQHYKGIKFPSADTVRERAAILKDRFPDWSQAEFYADLIPEETVQSADEMLELFGLQKLLYVNSIPITKALREHGLIAFASDPGGDLFCVRSKDEALKVYRVYSVSLTDGKLQEYLREYGTFPRFMEIYIESLDRLRRFQQGDTTVELL
jgi:hypothetical protein